MPYPRPALSALRAQVAADITSGLKTVDGLLRFSNLGILGTSLAGLSHQHYGYLAWIAKQSNPFTATEEILEAWAALKNVFRKAPGYTHLQGVWLGSAGAPLPEGTEVARGDGVYYRTAAAAVADANGVLSVELVAVEPGAGGNAEDGTQVTLTSAAPGIQSTGAVTDTLSLGTPLESDDSLRTRMLVAYQAPARGGANGDYTTWALAVDSVTRAWVVPMGFGAGTVVVYVMMDLVNSDHNGFPVGGNGISALDNRATAGNTATVDLLEVANAVFAKQPVTPMVYWCSPIPAPVDFTISGLKDAAPTVKAAVSNAIAQVMIDHGAPEDGGHVDIDAINSAIGIVPGSAGFIITSPAENIPNVRGYLPTVGVITYA